MYRISPTPDEFSAARAIVDDALRRAAAVYPLETEAVVEIGRREDDVVVDALDGASGYASYPNEIEIEFATAADDWRDSLRSTTVHEYAHVVAYERRGRESEEKWEYVLEEAFTQHVAKRLVPEYRSPWWTKYSAREVSAYWERIRDAELRKASEEAGPLFIDPDDGGFPHGLGYSMSYQLGAKLLKDVEPMDLLDVRRSDLVRAGDELYDS